MNSSLQKLSIRSRSMLFALGLLALFLLPLWGRCVYESGSNLMIAESARDAGDMTTAIRAYGKSLRWRAVFNPYAQRAQHELISLQSKLKGEELISLLNETRRALFLSRNFYFQTQDEQKLIDQIDQQLVALGARSVVDIQPVQKFVPNFVGQISAQVGFWAWIVSVLVLIRTGFTREGAILRLPCLIAGSASVIFFVFWLLLLARA